MSEHVDQSVVLANYASSALSAAGSLFIIICFLCSKKIREIYHIRIVFSIGVANLLFTLSGAGELIPGILENDGQNPICKAFGFVRQFFSVASVLLTAVFALMVLLWSSSKLSNIRKYEAISMTLVGVISLATSLYILLADKLGYSTLICWIRNDLPEKETFILFFVEFYGIFFLVLLMNFYCFIQTIRKKRSNMNNWQAFQLLLFPGVLLFCFLGALVDRIVLARDQKSPRWLQVWHIIGAQLFGLCNALIYGFSRNIRIIVKESFSNCCLCRKKPKQSMTSTMITKPLISPADDSSSSSEQLNISEIIAK